MFHTTLSTMTFAQKGYTLGYERIICKYNLILLQMFVQSQSCTFFIRLIFQLVTTKVARLFHFSFYCCISKEILNLITIVPNSAVRVVSTWIYTNLFAFNSNDESLISLVKVSIRPVKFASMCYKVLQKF